MGGRANDRLAAAGSPKSRVLWERGVKERESKTNTVVAATAKNDAILICAANQISSDQSEALQGPTF